MNAIHTILDITRFTLLSSSWIWLVQRALTALLCLLIIFKVLLLALRNTNLQIFIKLRGRITLSAFHFLRSLIFIATSTIFGAHSTSPWIFSHILSWRADFALPSLGIYILIRWAILAANSFLHLIDFEAALTSLANRLGRILRQLTR